MTQLKFESSVSASGQIPLLAATAWTPHSSNFALDADANAQKNFLQQQDPVGGSWTETGMKLRPHPSADHSDSIGSGSSPDSSTSLDVSLSALIATEEKVLREEGEGEEEEAAVTRGERFRRAPQHQEEFGITNYEILAYALGYDDVLAHPRNQPVHSASNAVNTAAGYAEPGEISSAMDFGGSGRGTAKRKRSSISQENPGDRYIGGYDYSSDNSSVSVDVSISAMIAVEEEEEAAARRSGARIDRAPQQEDLLTDEEILAFLGYNNN